MKSFFCFLLLSFSLLVSGFAQNVKGKDDALTFIGSISGATLYNSHLVIGMTADGLVDKVYEMETANELVGEQVKMLGDFVNQLVSLRGSGFLTNNDDILFCNDLINTAGLVKKEAELLQRYTSTQNDTDADNYMTAHEEAWTSLSALLGIE